MPEKQFPDTSFCLCKIRIDFNTAEEYADRLHAITTFVKDYELDIKDQVAGIHNHTKRHGEHFHYHLVLNGDYNNSKPFKNPSYYFNKHLAKIGLKEKFGYSIGKIEQLYIDETQPDVDTAYHKFIRYPLKDKQPIHNLCSYTEEELSVMANTAFEENRFAQEQLIKKQQEEQMKITKWTDIRDYLDSKNATDLQVIWQLVAKYMSTDQVPPTIKAVTTIVERYVIYKADPQRLCKIAETQVKHLESYLDKFST